MKLNFAKNKWNMDDVTYAYSYRFEQTPVFTQEEDCIANRRDPDGPAGFEYISLLSRCQYGKGSSITTTCSFERYGAPLIVIADKLYRDENRNVRFGNYIEVVAFEEGVNVWRMWYKDGKVSWKLLMGVRFPVSPKEKHTLSATVNTEQLLVDVDGHKMQVYIPDLYTSFHLGINACEEINRFYNMEITGEPVELFRM